MHPETELARAATGFVGRRIQRLEDHALRRCCAAATGRRLLRRPAPAGHRTSHGQCTEDAMTHTLLEPGAVPEVAHA